MASYFSVQSVRGEESGGVAEQIDQGNVVESHYNHVVESIDCLGLKESLKNAIHNLHTGKLTSLEQRTIVPCLKGRDLNIEVPTGQSMMIMIGISILERIEESRESVQALVIVPSTKEAEDLVEVLNGMALGTHVKTLLCVNNTSIVIAQQTFRRGVHVVVGTPVKLLNIIDRGDFDTSAIRILHLDNVNDLYHSHKSVLLSVLCRLPHQTQVVASGSVMSSQVDHFVQQFLMKPMIIKVREERELPENVAQFYVTYGSDSLKYGTLLDLLKSLGEGVPMVVFCNSYVTVEYLTDQLHKQQINVVSAHSFLEVEKFKANMRSFHKGKSSILICTDVLVPGVDVVKAGVVVNYDLPSHVENLICRMGRSGVFGGDRVAITFIPGKDSDFLKDIEAFYKVKVEETPIDIASLI